MDSCFHTKLNQIKMRFINSKNSCVFTKQSRIKPRKGNSKRSFHSRTQQLYVGLSARTFVQNLRQRSLILFKLMLLERKVLFYQSPVSELTSYFLTLLSLHPRMLEDGLDEAARYVWLIGCFSNEFENL